jgi:hypothetical protein
MAGRTFGNPFGEKKNSFTLAVAKFAIDKIQILPDPE